ncbi:DUF4007 family protein [Azospirillum tabaci]|uniref:DUF4007 family protein n=1 Tax=Azospirillum tabaci TaxID=2752310 RepID=UPI001B3BF4DA|nr:DUF4007 family protein [Azospirillum tabaci]
MLDDERFKLQFAGHETFPLRYGWLKKSFDAIFPDEEREEFDSRSIFTTDDAIANFGVGKNMVASMRHWSLASGILRNGGAEGEDPARLYTTELGRLILGEADPYLEHPASLWLIHWHFASMPGRATTWYWAFNEFHEPTFSRELLRTRLLRRCEELREAGRLRESRITETTLRRDVECFIRTYVARLSTSRASHEESLECPLAELFLIQPVEVGGAFQFRRGPKPTLPDEVFLFGLVQFWTTLFPKRGEFSVETLTHEPGSPGRVFLLDEETVADRLARLTDLTKGAIRWDESTGLRQVYSPDPKAAKPFKHLKRLFTSHSGARAA